MIPGKIFTSFAEFQRIVSVNDFRIPLGFQELLQASLRFLWSFVFARICFHPLSGQVLHHDCISLIVSRFTIFTENFVICCFQVTRAFCTRYGSAIPSSARSAFGIFVLWQIFQEMSFNTVITQIYTSRKRGLWRCFMRRVGVWVSVFRYFITLEIFSEFLHPLRDLRFCATGVGKQRVSPFYHGLLFICFWEFLVGLATLLVIGFTANSGSPSSIINIRTWHMHWRGMNWTLILSFSSLTVAWCWGWWWRRARRTIPLLSWRCLWGWRVRTGGRTRWQAWYHDRNEVLRVALYPNTVLNEMWFLTVDQLIRVSVFIEKLSERQYCWRIFEDFIVKNISNSLTYTVASSCVCTSPLAVMTIVGLHDFGKVSISASLKSILVIMCTDAAESTADSRSSGFRVDAGRHQFSESEKNVAWFSVWYTDGQFPRRFAGTLLLPLCLFLRPILKSWSVDDVHLGKSFRAKDFNLEF